MTNTSDTKGLDIDTPILVIGAGAMGSGIAHVAAKAGHQVFLCDQDQAAVDKGIQSIQKDLQFLVGKNKLGENDAHDTLKRIIPVASLDSNSDCSKAGLAIEAIVENLEVKQKLFQTLEALLPPSSIIASNTSSLSITAMGKFMQDPTRLAGLHFFNPAPRMKLVEIISGLATNPEIANCLYQTATNWGKIAVHARSTPGFIVNRVARPYYGESLRLLEEQAESPATLDALLRESGQFPMGAFELMDLIGLDVNFAVSQSVYQSYFGDKRFTPSQVQRELVDAGRYGRKTGLGFYDYRAGAEKKMPNTLAKTPHHTQSINIADFGLALNTYFDPLRTRLETSGISVITAHPSKDAVLAVSDGRTASQRAIEDGMPNLVLCDLCFDYLHTPRLGITKADSCSDSAFNEIVGLLQSTGIALSPIDDIAGMVVLRTVCMLANVSADTVLHHVASEGDIDLAMQNGTNYPRGPLNWGRLLGLPFVCRVLENLHRHYGEERYRLSPWLQRQAIKNTISN